MSSACAICSTINCTAIVRTSALTLTYICCQVMFITCPFHTCPGRGQSSIRRLQGVMLDGIFAKTTMADKVTHTLFSCIVDVCMCTTCRRLQRSSDDCRGESSRATEKRNPRVQRRLDPSGPRVQQWQRKPHDEGQLYATRSR